jgi:hypothetical protein
MKNKKLSEQLLRYKSIIITSDYFLLFFLNTFYNGPTKHASKPCRLVIHLQLFKLNTIFALLNKDQNANIYIYIYSM